MSFHNLLEQIYNNIFSFNNTNILVLFDKNNTIWMSYNSILKSLGYNDIKKLKKRIDIKNNYFSTYKQIYLQSKLNKIKPDYQKPNETFINESGIYLLLSKSSKEVAKQLSEKLFVEVLPELRKTGKFILNSDETKDMKKLTKRIQSLDLELKRTTKILKSKTKNHSRKHTMCAPFIQPLDLSPESTLTQTNINIIKSATDESCFSIDALRKIADKWNTTHPNKAIEYTDATTGKYLWNSINNAMSAKCDNEVCWLKQDFISDTPLSQELA